MLHYLFLSVEHAIRKYVERVYDPDEVASRLAPASGRASRRGHHASSRSRGCGRTRATARSTPPIRGTLTRSSREADA